MPRSSCSVISQEETRKPCSRRKEHLHVTAAAFATYHFLLLIALGMSCYGPLHPHLKPHSFIYYFVATFLIRSSGFEWMEKEGRIHPMETRWGALQPRLISDNKHLGRRRKYKRPEPHSINILHVKAPWKPDWTLMSDGALVWGNFVLDTQVELEGRCRVNLSLLW